GGGGLRDIGHPGEVAHPHRPRACDHVLDGGDPVDAGSRAGTRPVAVAVGADLGLAAGDRHLRHLLALLPHAGAAERRRDDRGADGFPARTARRAYGLADLHGADRPAHRRRRRPDPGRQPPQPEGSEDLTHRTAPLTRNYSRAYHIWWSEVAPNADR